MRTYDFVAVGLGPFNLGLACLTAPVDDLDGVFLEQRDEFAWHPGLMIEGVTIQVPFLADLVTMADPTSPYSFLNYLKQTGRLYRFYIRENFYPLRAEYDAYCRWAAAQLPNVRFGSRVERVEHDAATGDYLVRVAEAGTGATTTLRTRRLVLGIGTVPYRPAVVRDLPGPAVHSADYLADKARLQSLGSVTVVGSGQSAAEIYLDLLEEIDTHGYQLNWVTRSPRFFPMEYTKLTLEMTSPEYVRYFHALPAASRDRLNRDQRNLYKGISGDLVDTIFDTLYRKDVGGPVPTTLLTGTALTGADWDPDTGRYRLALHHQEQDRDFTMDTDGLVLATGYRPAVAAFLDPVRDRIRWDERGRFDVALGYTVDHGDREIFVQNAEEHTHSLTAPDLGMGPYRNSVIIANMLGREVYPIERKIAFQHFGAPSDSNTPSAPAAATGPVVTQRQEALIR
ncbi:lysine N(6)-hydroxylase/L-ornithine N(5)-oxygenase family protein [Solwaraspora sp. WMMD937]|uniref:lysine N(6)-hydroxylase/L-ornithine N(5)-oxygenase family protein n=1 Tax=Solwaraspora sp. WMMD937 TaxID=3016090 RepID=UPI00249A20D9|nr:lysine N(6)-hydroxylase/L-ornithine N(5)-oxygenase family protein [Solwaraspora sp. WMMD937]WFE20668.1 lysine N(6)-hydroxylase/L-ornithine N(5)-oxygenase family protein [Solwaraspora sp. WMMD937]